MEYLLIDLTKIYDIPYAGKGDIKNHVHITRNSDTYEMFLITNGEVNIEQENISYNLKVNEVFFSKPDIPYGGNNQLSSAQFFWLHFKSKNGIKIIPEEETIQYITNPNYVILPQYLSLKNTDHIKVLLSELNSYFSELSPYKIKNSLLKAIFCELEYLYKNQLSNKSSKKFFDIIEYLTTNPNLNEFPTIKSLSEHFGYNEKYLTRLFKKNLGVSPKDLLINIKLGIAKSYLTDSNLEIKEIAYYLNYNEEYFLRLFKAKIGLTPTQYRKAITPDYSGYDKNIKSIITGVIKSYPDEVSAIKAQYERSKRDD